MTTPEPAEDDETAYLMRSPANAQRLTAAIERLENGGGTVRELVDPDESKPVPPLPCIVCGRRPEPVAEQPWENHGPAQPYGAVTFTSPGHYGSGEFDPMDGSYLLTNVCDACLLVKARPEFGAVWHAQVTRQPAVVFSRPWVADLTGDQDPLDHLRAIREGRP